MAITNSNQDQPKIRLSIVGSAGVPARYGGFETLVENLAIYSEEKNVDFEITIYCSGPYYDERIESFHGAKLRYVPLKANGAQSIAYDIWSMFSALFHRADVILVLGVSGAMVIPLLKLISRVPIVINVDGIEWRREKWTGFSRWILRLSEKIGAKFSRAVIADNDFIVKHIEESYDVSCSMIPYGGDHTLATANAPYQGDVLPDNYALTICRIEPENNIRTIVEALAERANVPLVFIGNWNSSAYGIKIREDFGHLPHLKLLDPIYDLAVLRSIRQGAWVYIHGHSAGGTNPSLIEAMQFHKNIIAYDCGFNRSTTEDKALYFKDSSELRILLGKIGSGDIGLESGMMKEIAMRRYTWAVVAMQYYNLLRLVHVHSKSKEPKESATNDQ